MQAKVHQVIAEHGITPEPVLEPEYAVQQGVILPRGAQVKPDLAQSVPRAELGSGTCQSSSQMRPPCQAG